MTDLSIDGFENKKLIVIGGSSGMGRKAAEDVVKGGGSAVIVGRKQATVDETVAALTSYGRAWGITANLADRGQTVIVYTPDKGSASAEKLSLLSSWAAPAALGREVIVDGGSAEPDGRETATS